MPGCVLRASGANFQFESFLKNSAFTPCNVFRKGEPKGKSSLWDSTGFTVVVSDDSGDDLLQQTRDAVGFMRDHKEELARLMSWIGLEDVRLDFGVNRKRNVFVQSNYLPAELVELAGALGVGLEVSLYEVDDL